MDFSQQNGFGETILDKMYETESGKRRRVVAVRELTSVRHRTVQVRKEDGSGNVLATLLTPQEAASLLGVAYDVAMYEWVHVQMGMGEELRGAFDMPKPVVQEFVKVCHFGRKLPTEIVKKVVGEVLTENERAVWRVVSSSADSMELIRSLQKKRENKTAFVRRIGQTAQGVRAAVRKVLEVPLLPVPDAALLAAIDSPDGDERRVKEAARAIESKIEVYNLAAIHIPPRVHELRGLLHAWERGPQMIMERARVEQEIARIQARAHAYDANVGLAPMQV